MANAWGKSWGAAFGSAWGVLEGHKNSVTPIYGGGGGFLGDSDGPGRRVREITRTAPAKRAKTAHQRRNEQVLLVLMQ